MRRQAVHDRAMPLVDVRASPSIHRQNKKNIFVFFMLGNTLDSVVTQSYKASPCCPARASGVFKTVGRLATFPFSCLRPAVLKRLLKCGIVWKALAFSPDELRFIGFFLLLPGKRSGEGLKTEKGVHR
jgi:hypothetical protein